MTKEVRYGLQKGFQGHQDASKDVAVTKEVGNTYLEEGHQRVYE